MSHLHPALSKLLIKLQVLRKSLVFFFMLPFPFLYTSSLIASEKVSEISWTFLELFCLKIFAKSIV